MAYLAYFETEGSQLSKHALSAGSAEELERVLAITLIDLGLDKTDVENIKIWSTDSNRALRVRRDRNGILYGMQTGLPVSIERH